MSADEAYGSGRDAGESRVARASCRPHVIPPVPYTALLPICRPPTHYCRAWFIRTLPARGCVLAPRGNGLSNPQTVIYKGGPTT